MNTAEVKLNNEHAEIAGSSSSWINREKETTVTFALCIEYYFSKRTNEPWQ